MKRSRVAPVVGLVLTLTCASCGGRQEGYYPVHGHVVYKGEPAAGAMLFFHRQNDGGAVKPEAVPSATVEDDGSFRVVSSTVSDGALPGKYAVLVSWPEKVSPGQSPAAEESSPSKKKRRIAGPSKRKNKIDPQANDRLKGRYFDPKSPRLTAEVKAQATDLGTLDLTN